VTTFDCISLSLCVCVCVCLPLCFSACISLCVHLCLSAYLFVCLCACLHVSCTTTTTQVFFPVIIASVPHLTFSRGSLAGIVALAEVLAYHVIEPDHALATTLCTELVKRIDTHSLGYETALRATRAALTRWAYEQNKGRRGTYRGRDRSNRDRSNRDLSGGKEREGEGEYDHGLDEPKEIVYPLLIRLRASLESDPSSSSSSSSSSSAAPSTEATGVLASCSRKRGRATDEEDSPEEEEDEDDEDDEDDEEEAEYSHARKCCRRSRESKAGAARDVLFTAQSLQRAAQDAQEVVRTPGTVVTDDKLTVLDECISIIERVLRKRREDALVSTRTEEGGEEEDKEDKEEEEEEKEGEYVDLVSDMLLDLQSLDLAGGLSSRGVVAAAMEKTCARMLCMDLVDE
jgi:hypothetical protein